MLSQPNFKGWDSTAWCVPTAVAILTGAPVGHMHSRAAFIQNNPLEDVEGVWSEEAVLMLGEQGFNAKPVDLIKRYADKTPCGPTLERFMRERTREEYWTTMLVTINNHMIAVHGDYAADNWTKRIVPFVNFPKPKRLVKEAWLVTERRP